jgi:hypothetical protein
MNISDAVKYVRERFEFRADPRFLDYWSVMKEVDGKMQGDCDDFALTSIWKMCDESILKFIWNVIILHRYRIYFAYTPLGEKHAVGYADGLYFDNWSRFPWPKEDFLRITKHRLYFFFPGPIIIFPILLGLLIRNR